MMSEMCLVSLLEPTVHVKYVAMCMCIINCIVIISSCSAVWESRYLQKMDYRISSNSSRAVY